MGGQEALDATKKANSDFEMLSPFGRITGYYITDEGSRATQVVEQSPWLLGTERKGIARDGLFTYKQAPAREDGILALYCHTRSLATSADVAVAAGRWSGHADRGDDYLRDPPLFPISH